jgi:putative DeoR family transcriptional regulator (stage III sporulation protein D)
MKKNFANLTKKQQVIEVARYIAYTGATVRAAGKAYGVSKSTVHKDMRELLPEIDKKLYKKVSAVLEKNWEERSERGGAATKAKFELLNEIKKEIKKPAVKSTKIKVQVDDVVITVTK